MRVNIVFYSLDDVTIARLVTELSLQASTQVVRRKKYVFKPNEIYEYQLVDVDRKLYSRSVRETSDYLRLIRGLRNAVFLGDSGENKEIWEYDAEETVYFVECPSPENLFQLFATLLPYDICIENEQVATIIV